jgi:hypothetical protein
MAVATKAKMSRRVARHARTLEQRCGAGPRPLGARLAAAGRRASSAAAPASEPSRSCSTRSRCGSARGAAADAGRAAAGGTRAGGLSVVRERRCASREARRPWTGQADAACRLLWAAARAGGRWSADGAAEPDVGSGAGYSLTRARTDGSCARRRGRVRRRPRLPGQGRRDRSVVE